MRNTHILIVDDEKAISEEIAEFLEYLGFIVSVATSANQALDRLKNTLEIEIVITDLNMPEKSGAYLIREANSIYGERLNFVVITGHVSLSESVKSTMSEFPNITAFLKKPIALEKLKEVLELSNKVSET